VKLLQEVRGQFSGRPGLLALRALKLGDLLVAVPAIHALRRANPEHFVILAVPGWLQPIVALIDGVDALLPTPGLDDPLACAPGHIDVAVNLHGNGPESRSLLERLGARRTIGHRAQGQHGPAWRDGMLERARWVRLVSAFGMPGDENDVGLREPDIVPMVSHATIVHAGAFYGSRQWPADRFAAVAAALSEDGATVLVSGSMADRPRALEIARRAGLAPDAVIAGRLDLGEFAAVVAAADLVVSADTGAAHVASAYGIPSVVIFGPAPPEEWGPPANGPHLVLTDASVRRGDTFASEPDPALLAVTTDQVLSAARSLRGVPVVRPSGVRPSGADRIRGKFVAQLSEDLGEQSGHLHLGDVHLESDFALRLLPNEPEVQNPPFSKGEAGTG
jgi:ADP-heptose:LPS heptosyltransferase